MNADAHHRDALTIDHRVHRFVGGVGCCLMPASNRLFHRRRRLDFAAYIDVGPSRQWFPPPSLHRDFDRLPVDYSLGFSRMRFMYAQKKVGTGAAETNRPSKGKTKRVYNERYIADEIHVGKPV